MNGYQPGTTLGSMVLELQMSLEQVGGNAMHVLGGQAILMGVHGFLLSWLGAYKSL